LHHRPPAGPEQASTRTGVGWSILSQLPRRAKCARDPAALADPIDHMTDSRLPIVVIGAGIVGVSCASEFRMIPGWLKVLPAGEIGLPPIFHRV